MSENSKQDEECEFEITSLRQSEKVFYCSDIPSCHFAKPTFLTLSSNNLHQSIFIKMESDKTCFMMIKSDTILDFESAIKASIWSSTPRGNDTLSQGKF